MGKTPANKAVRRKSATKSLTDASPKGMRSRVKKSELERAESAAPKASDLLAAFVTFSRVRGDRSAFLAHYAALRPELTPDEIAHFYDVAKQHAITL